MAGMVFGKLRTDQFVSIRAYENATIPLDSEGTDNELCFVTGNNEIVGLMKRMNGTWFSVDSAFSNAKMFCGFVDKSNAKFSFTGRQFKIEPVSTTYKLQRNVVPIVKSAAETVSIAGSNAEGMWYFYWNGSNVLSATQDESVPFVYPNIFACSAYWDETNDAWVSKCDERYSCSMPKPSQKYLYAAGNASSVSSFSLTAMNGMTNSSLRTNAVDSYLAAQIRVSSGAIRDVDQEFSIAHADIPSFDWNTANTAFLGFKIAVDSYNAGTPSITFGESRTFYNGQVITVMEGDTNTVRGASTVNGNVTGPTVTLNSTIPGTTAGDRVIVGARVPVVYNTPNGWRKVAATDYPFVVNGGSAQYNDVASGLSSMTNGRFFSVFLVATKDVENPVVAVLGQAQSSDTDLQKHLTANINQFSNLTLGAGFPFRGAVPFYRLTFEANSTWLGKARLRDMTECDIELVRQFNGAFKMRDFKQGAFNGWDSSNSQVTAEPSDFTEVVVTAFAFTSSSVLNIEIDGVHQYEGVAFTRDVDNQKIVFSETVTAPAYVFVGKYR